MGDNAPPGGAEYFSPVCLERKKMEVGKNLKYPLFGYYHFLFSFHLPSRPSFSPVTNYSYKSFILEISEKNNNLINEKKKSKFQVRIHIFFLLG